MSNEFNNEFDTAFSAGFADNGGGGVTMFNLTDLATRSIVRDLVRKPTQGLFQPKNIQGLVLHCRYRRGITVTGAGVSQWDDVSGQGNHLLQATDTNRPSLETDGTILLDGVDNFLKANAFTLGQPATVFLLGKQITWLSADNWFDGDTASTGLLQQVTSTPQVAANADIESSTISPTLDTYVVITVVFNGANSVLQLNNDTPITGDFGADTLDGFTLGAIGGGASGFGNIQVKEVIVYNALINKNERSRVIRHLSHVDNL